MCIYLKNNMRILKSLTIALLLCTVGAASIQAQDLPMKAAHEVKTGETLYSISKHYNVSVEDLRKANPRMGETLLTGSVIFIPMVGEDEAQKRAEQEQQMANIHATDGPGMVKENIPCKTMYQVQKKETVFSISRQFHISEEELLRANPQIEDGKIKKGEYLCIPYSANEIYEMQRESQEYAQRQREREAEEKRAAEEAALKARQLQNIKVAVILPFSLETAKKSKESVKMYDFYEGFLLAVEELKKQGVSLDIYAYEEPSTLANEIDQLLSNPQMAKMNLIVGPMRVENIPALSRFAQQHNIPLAIPFSTRASITASSPVCYQINTNISQFYKDIFNQFVDRYQHHNIVIVSTGDKGEKADYLLGLKQVLDESAVAYKTATLADLSTLSQLTSGGERTVIVPVSNTRSAFEKVVAKLDNTDIDASTIDMFGFPEWQTFSEKNKQSMRKYHASFFCTFYTDPTSTQVQDFNRQFKFWFKRDQMNTYPQYGLLGYDTGKFFLTGLHQYGLDFMNNSTSMRIAALQNPMQFERLSSGFGYANTHFRIVSF